MTTNQATVADATCIARLSAADAEEFATLVKAGENRAAEVRVLERLLAEKRAEVQTHADQLRHNFNVQPTRTYVYEPESRILYVVASNAVVGAKTTSVNRVACKKLETPEEAEVFTRLVNAKQLAEQLAVALDLLAREKRTARERTDHELHARFKLDATRSYHFDLPSRRIFVLPAQGSNVVTASRPAGFTE